MSKFFKIVSNDRKFSKMLSLCLIESGFTEISDSFPDSERSERYIIADVDLCSHDDLAEMAKDAQIVGFTKGADVNEPICSAIFTRPFHISNFLAFFGGTEKLLTYIPEKRKESVKKPNVLSIDEGSATALWGDMKISLSENEYRVLKLLCERRGEMVERELIDQLLGVTEGNMGDVYICHLRRKIDNKLGLKLIYTVRGKGYMLKN